MREVKEGRGQKGWEKNTHKIIFWLQHWLTGGILAVDARWLDKLGIAARMGVDVVARQSFFHGHYALLDDNMQPRPVCAITWFITQSHSSARMCFNLVHYAVSLLGPYVLYAVSLLGPYVL